jgi:hypothetical protein
VRKWAALSFLKENGSNGSKITAYFPEGMTANGSR